MIHVFPYSARRGTPAAKMSGQIPQEIKKARSAELISLEKGIRAAELDRILAEKKPHTVLFESYDHGFAYGHTPDFLEVAVKSAIPLHAETRKVRLTHTDGNICFGELVE
jgi:threonylcarbamoyladenosine tRNA methylthiotransferase MtaB